MNLGVAAHISAASPGGPRYRPDLTPRQRQSARNGVWLCQTHAKEVDNDPATFTESLLHAWRTEAERIAAAELGTPRLYSAVAASARFSLRLNAAYWAQDQRAEHQLSVLVKNVGQEPIERYYCEVDVRHGLIDNPPTSLHFQPDRSSNEWDLFLFDEKNRPSLYPGQECVVWTTMLATDLSGPSGILARVRFKPAGASIAEGRLEWPVQDGAGV
jgi:hypothetical protein